jgi:hypothetical protein
MPDVPTVTDTVRRAAALLRERATAATPGPWRAEPGSSGMNNRDEPWAADYVAPPAGVPRFKVHTVADAAYIATVHPTVALLIADSWDAAVVEMAHWSAYEDDAGRVTQCLVGVRDDWTATLAAARALLGEMEGAS